MVRLGLALAIVLGVAPGVEAQHEMPADGGRRVQVLGFGDVNYVETERAEREGFRQGQVIGHVAAPLSERATVFVEASATAIPEAVRVDVERLVFRYDFADVFKLSAGRYHTPLGYWNTAFHHGLWLQTTADRPQMVRFGGEVVPVHFVGLLAEGAVFGPGAEVRYTAGVGNGRSGDLARAGGSGDVNGQRAALGSVAVRPEAVYGLELGVGAYRDRVGLVVGTVDETIFSAHLAFERETPEVLAEVVRVVHEAGGATTTSDAGYVQLAVRLPGAAAPAKPYVRYERIDVGAGDALFDPALDYEGAIGGVRFDVAPSAALKGEYRYERMGAGEPHTHGVYAQVSFVFGGPSL